MPTAVAAPIVLDEQGIAYVEGTAIKVLELVRVGQSAEALREEFPHLSLAQIHGALSYYHQHKEALDSEIEQRDRLVVQLQAEATEHPFARRMRGGRAAALMVRLYFDEGVQGAIARGLRSRGVEFITVQAEGLEGMPDPGVLDRASSLGCVLFSQDEDLLAEATHRQRAGMPFAGVIFAHQRRVSTGRCVEYLELIAVAGDPEEFAGRVFFIPH